MRQWFLHFLVGLLRKILNTKILIASMKTLNYSETCTVKRIKVLLWLMISVIGQVSPRDHLLLDRGKVGLNSHVGRVTIFRITAGFRSKFHSNAWVSECCNKLFEEGYWKDFKNE
jgi:hypothetical protein